MNKVILMGRLTKDPEQRFVGTEKIPTCSFNLAVDRKYKREGEPEADFFPIVAWRKTAEFCSKYFVKGMRVSVVGSLSTRTWDDTEGNKHYVTEIVIDEAYFADGKKEGAPHGNNAPPPNTQQNNTSPQNNQWVNGTPPSAQPSEAGPKPPWMV